MRILLLVHAFNSLSQRLFVELEAAGHEVSVEFDIHDDVTGEAVEQFRPDVILAPFLKRAIPERIWQAYLCLIVHPGIIGDRGPSALDWAILNRESMWGVTVLQAEAAMDAGPVWAHAEFHMRDSAKSSLYRREVTEAAVEAVRCALERVHRGSFTPHNPRADKATMKLGIERPYATQADRQIDWTQDDTLTVMRKIRSADGVPGVRDTTLGQQVYLYDAHVASGLKGKSGDIIAKSGPAICRATRDGAVWIGHMRDVNSEHSFKLPATRVLDGQLEGVPDIAIDSSGSYREIRYEEYDHVGYLHFEFYNGAMAAEACERLLSAYQEACQRPTRIIILMGGAEFWSNGMHLNLIEAADNPADESWRNINAIDDLAEAILNTKSHLTIAAMQGNAGAGGVFLARAADLVWLRSGVVLNPHYKDMGNLYGSEFWTYLLPLYAGADNARHITHDRVPMSASRAVELGLADTCFGADHNAFLHSVNKRASKLAASTNYDRLLDEKRQRRRTHEAARPLAEYRRQELEEMRRNFYGPDPSYHVARYNFVHKIPKSHTPRSLARHRRQTAANHQRKAS